MSIYHKHGKNAVANTEGFRLSPGRETVSCLVCTTSVAASIAASITAYIFFMVLQVKMGLSEGTTAFLR